MAEPGLQAHKAAPRIDHPEELERMVRQIVARVDPIAIYLFGSRARGDAHADSDYDLLFIVPDNFPADQATPSRAFELISGRRVPMDAVMVRASRFLERASKVGTLSYEAAHDGIRIYER